MAAELAIDRIRRFSKMKSVEKANRKHLGVRLSVEQLLQLLTKLTGKRALLVDEPAGRRPSLDDAELTLVNPANPTGDPYRMTVSVVSAEERAITNENTDPNSEYNATKYPTAKGVVFMVGKQQQAMALTLDYFPIVGQDKPSTGTGRPKWDFMTHSNRYGYAFTDGGGGTGSKTPPPGS